MLGACVAAAGVVPSVAGPIDAMVAAQVAAPVAAPGTDGYDFRLPSLPLDEALQRFGQLTGHSVLYETRLVAGKTASAVVGRYDATTALGRLLAGTGLAARMTRGRSVMLLAMPQPADPRARSRYDGQLEAQVRRALCDALGPVGASHRIALSLWVDGDQRIGELRVRVAAQPALEPVVRGALAGLHVGALPPGVDQPAILLVAPETEPGTGACAP